MRTTVIEAITPLNRTLRSHAREAKISQKEAAGYDIKKLSGVSLFQKQRMRSFTLGNRLSKFF